MKTKPPITVTRKDIEQTEFYQELNPILKKMTMQKRNVECIQNGVNISNHIGFDNWEKQTATRYTNRVIIKEIFEQKTSEIAG